MNKEIIKELSKLYKVRVYFYNNRTPGIGYHRYNKKHGRFYESIHIYEKDDDILSIFFHELGHSYCTHNNKFPSYHKLKDGRWINGNYKRNIKGLQNVIRTCYRAECYVDRWADKEMRIWFPDIKYRAGYVGNSDAKNWLNHFHLPYFREALLLKNKRKK